MKKDSNQVKTSQDTYKRVGLIAFGVLAGILILFFFLFKINSIKNAVLTVFSVLQPIIIGFVIAYLANPVMKFFDKYLTKFFVGALKFKKIGYKISRMISIILSLILFFAVIAVLVYLVVPEIYSSVMSLIQTLPAKIDAATVWVKGFFDQHPQISEFATSFLDYEKQWVQTDLLGWATNYAGTIASGVMKTANFIFDLVIGIVVAVYLLLSKENFKAQFKKVCYAAMGPSAAEGTITVLKKSHEVFGGFISGKLIDSLIIGILCFIGVSLLDMPFAILVSVIIGITNIIPVFGPYIGAIPSILLITLVDPLKGLYFTIFVILLQTFDGNILGPKILGDSTGLSPFWVVFAIVLGGGLFGVVGLLIGVPLFAVIYYLINEAVRYRLGKKNLPLETEDYTKVGKIEPLVTENEEETENPQEEDQETVRKKELIEKMNTLVDGMNTLQRQLTAYREENTALKAELYRLSEESKKAATAEPVTEPKNGFSVTEPLEEATFENAVIKEEKPVAAPVSPQPVLENDKITEYAALAIGSIVKESVNYVDLISSSSSPDKKELLNLIMGKGEVAKSEIFSISEGDSPESIKRELIDTKLNETVDYFKSVAGQI